MATPKKENKIRDYDRTRERMLEVVGEILKDSGFGGLTTNNIARRLGKDKKLIRYYFNSLYNLEKEFIMQHDHWLSYLRQLELPRDISADQAKDLFVEFASAHFDAFLNSKELQKVMLWELTQQNPLLKSIANDREIGAECLLNASRSFVSEDGTFRAVLALVFGGFNFLVLQGAENKTSTWGIDVNTKKDREILIQTASKLIDWAWSKQSGSYL